MEKALVGVEVIARSNNDSLRQALTSTAPFSSISTSSTFWRPWEASCEATAGRERSDDAITLLGCEGMTPPVLVTPPREEVRSTGRKVGRKVGRSNMLYLCLKTVEL